MSGAPAVLAAAQSLATAAAAKKDEVLKELNDQVDGARRQRAGLPDRDPEPHRLSGQEVQQKGGRGNRSGRREGGA